MRNMPHPTTEAEQQLLDRKFQWVDRFMAQVETPGQKATREGYLESCYGHNWFVKAPAEPEEEKVIYILGYIKRIQ